MEKSILSKNDYVNITKIIKTTEVINNLYGKLLLLDVNNQKVSKEYNKYLDYLNIAIEVEEREYKNLNVNTEKLYQLIQYVSKDIDVEKFSTDVDSIINRNYKNKVIRRIVKNIKSLIINKGKINVPDGFREILDHYDLDYNEEYVSKTIKDNIETDRNIQNQFAIEFLKNIEKTKNNEKFLFYKEELTTLKYYLSFIDNNIEKNMRFNNFDIMNLINFSENLIIKLIGVNKNFYKAIKKEFSYDIITEQITELINFYDDDYKDSNIMFESLVRKCLLEAGLKMTTNAEVENISVKFEQFLNNKFFNKIHENDLKSKTIIRQALNKYNNKAINKELTKE